MIKYVTYFLCKNFLQDLILHFMLNLMLVVHAIHIVLYMALYGWMNCLWRVNGCLTHLYLKLGLLCYSRHECSRYMCNHFIIQAAVTKYWIIDQAFTFINDCGVCNIPLRKSIVIETSYKIPICINSYLMKQYL